MPRSSRPTTGNPPGTSAQRPITPLFSPEPVQERATSKEMIVAGPYNIYPRDVEEVLYEHPKVLEAAVAGVPRADGGAELKAFVVLRRGESATAEEIIQFLRERISSYKLPGAVEFRAALPRSFIGKVLRRVLMERVER